MTVRTTITGVVLSCAYTKETDIKLGVSVASHKLHTGVVDGLVSVLRLDMKSE